MSTSPSPGIPARTILALVNDLFFALKIRDTASHLGYAIEIAATMPDFFDKLVRAHPALLIVDLNTNGVDMEAVLRELKADPQQGMLPLLAYTTHADWKRTGPLHAQCTTVVTKDALSRGLPDLIQELIQRG